MRSSNFNCEKEKVKEEQSLRQLSHNSRKREKKIEKEQKSCKD